MSSVSGGIHPSSPRLPTFSQRNGIALQPKSSRSSAASSARDEDVIQQETEAEIRERETLDAMNEIVMAIDMKERGSLGCAYYIARDEKVYVMEDVKMASLELLDTLKIYIQPTVVLISTRCEEKLEDNLGKDARGIDRGDDASTFRFLGQFKQS